MKISRFANKPLTTQTQSSDTKNNNLSGPHNFDKNSFFLFFWERDVLTWGLEASPRAISWTSLMGGLRRNIMLRRSTQSRLKQKYEIHFPAYSFMNVSVVRRDDELSFKRGALITHVVQQEGGWWRGDQGGRRQHWFPANFTQLEEAPGQARIMDKRSCIGQRASVL